ncbi:MAG: hypothetical protein II166_04945 [Firmicutes bacterium]|nr:hypothetical protein [Bacillota bacterium]
MNREQLYKMLEIDTPADLEYFEQVADLIECGEYIPEELFSEVLSGIRAEDAGEIAENYIEEISNALPEDSDDMAELLENIQSRLMLLAEGIETKEGRRKFTDELYRFRQWYTEPFGVSLDGHPASFLEAVTASRLEKLGHGGNHTYDLENRLGYELDELTMDLGRFSPIDVADYGDEEDPEE